MRLRDEFESRFKDIETQFEYLSFIDGIEAYKGGELKSPTSVNTYQLTSETQKIERASVVILLYNVIEFTAFNCGQKIFDTISDAHIPFDKLSPKLFDKWLSVQFPHNLGVEKSRKKFKSILKNSSKSINMEFPDNAFSGNVDLRKIKEVFGEIGCDVNFTFKSDTVGQSLLKVKNARNKLAHGEVTFASLGSQFVFSDLRTFKSDIKESMEKLIGSVEDFLMTKKYLSV